MFHTVGIEKVTRWRTEPCDDMRPPAKEIAPMKASEDELQRNSVVAKIATTATENFSRRNT